MLLTRLYFLKRILKLNDKGNGADEKCEDEGPVFEVGNENDI